MADLAKSLTESGLFQHTNDSQLDSLKRYEFGLDQKQYLLIPAQFSQDIYVRSSNAPFATGQQPIAS
jgi:hypothetical protein